MPGYSLVPGGEGAVHDVLDNPELVAKVYHRGKRPPDLELDGEFTFRPAPANDRRLMTAYAAAAANLSAQVMPPTTIAAGTAARRKSSDERRERIRGLHCEGLDNRAIAHGLGVSVRTVQRALKAAKDLATDRT